MSTKAMWEVDPETRSKLLEIQKANNNDRCADCNAPSPQWASPKFGVFICLSCAGVHRGLGVHISFVRSITMDAFKAAEIERMRLGGNKTWKDFFDNADENKMAGTTWDDATIAERYSGDVGEEYKERLSAKVEGKEYVKEVGKPKPKPVASQSASAVGSRSQTPSGMGGTASSGGSGIGEARKAKVDDKYFARLGADNASRPADLHPSQGGKYAGFGSAPPEPVKEQGSLPGFDDLQKDPVAALTKGFGWFTTTVSKTAKTVNDSYITPAAQQIAQADITAQARLAAAQVAKTAQTGAKGAADGFNRFVEGSDGPATGGRRKPIDETKTDFWDSFGKPEESKPSAIGTAAMRGNNGGSSGGMGGASKKDEDDWGKW